MEFRKNKYVSMFKIDGIPILPPLMTAEKRKEMSHYKQKAIMVEKALHESQLFHTVELAQAPSTARSGVLSECLIEDEYLKVSSIMQITESSMSVEIEDIQTTSNPMECLKKSDTFIYDVLKNTVMVPQGLGEGDWIPVVVQEDIKMLESADCIPSITLTPTIIDQTDASIASDTTEEGSTYPILSAGIPSIEINPPTPLVPNKVFVTDSPGSAKAPQRSATSPSLKADSNSENTLIRSNSFTLESPSNALLQHIQNKKSELERKSKPLGRVTRDTIESKAKKVQKVDQKPKPETKFGNSAFRCKKSPYESRSTGKVKLLRKHKPSQTKLAAATPTSSEPMSDVNTDLFRDIEAQHRKKMLDLLRQQQDEQKRLQQAFEHQQRILLEQLNADMTKVQITSAPIQTEPDSPLSSRSSLVSETTSYLNKSLSDSSVIPRNTPRRRLFMREVSPQLGGESREFLGGVGLGQRRDKAATVINAYVRGYLVRRLFSTDHVQRIVQTIRDTLIFALDFHMETRNDDSVDNLKFKARLLQQLTSACDNLRHIFFELSTKDKMAVISKDRKCIKTKMAVMKCFVYVMKPKNYLMNIHLNDQI